MGIASPDDYISTLEAATLYGTDRAAMRREAIRRGWDSVRFFSNMLAYDLDDFLDWHMGLQKPDRRPCLGCGKPSMVDRYYCDRCAQLRKGCGVICKEAAGVAGLPFSSGDW